MNINKFDFFGLYPKPVSQMRNLELLFSACMTVFLVLGTISIIQIALYNFTILLVAAVLVIPAVTLVYSILLWGRATSKPNRTMKRFNGQIRTY